MWGAHIIGEVQQKLKAYSVADVEFVMFLPEAHLLLAEASLEPGSPIKLGSQGIYRLDTSVGGNFGAFTTNRTANAVKEMGCSYTLIGHCEERWDKAGIMAEAGIEDSTAVNRILRDEIKAARRANLSVLYCVGEKSGEEDRWQEVLDEQLGIGLEGVDTRNVVIGYEPVWSIGPGKRNPGASRIAQVARYIKGRTCGLDVVYGGGLKAGNAKEMAEILDLDGGLIALTRFTGEIGFYPEEYLEIISLYLSHSCQKGVVA
jgi:triosephosphate isomerase